MAPKCARSGRPTRIHGARALVVELWNNPPRMLAARLQVLLCGAVLRHHRHRPGARPRRDPARRRRRRADRRRRRAARARRLAPGADAARRRWARGPVGARRAAASPPTSWPSSPRSPTPAWRWARSSRSARRPRSPARSSGSSTAAGRRALVRRDRARLRRRDAAGARGRRRGGSVGRRASRSPSSPAASYATYTLAAKRHARAGARAGGGDGRGVRAGAVLLLPVLALGGPGVLCDAAAGSRSPSSSASCRRRSPTCCSPAACGACRPPRPPR